MSDVSSTTSKGKGTFITGTRVNKADPDSPTAKAAKALAIINNQPIEEEPVPEMALAIKDNMPVFSNPGDEVLYSLTQTEHEMNMMFKDLNDLEERIKGNKDIKQMEVLMETTNEALSHHMKSYETLKNNIMLINQEAHEACQGLEFYEESEAMKFEKGLTKKKLEMINEEDEEAYIIGGGASHEDDKRDIFSMLSGMSNQMT